MLKVILKRGKEQSLNRFHPWIFSGAVHRVLLGGKELNMNNLSAVKESVEGEIAEVFSFDGSFMAIGHFSVGSIMVRVLSFEKREINAEFWREKIGNAFALRKSLIIENPSFQREDSKCNCYRLIHGEGDFLPALIVDIYGNVAVIQTHSSGMLKSANAISDSIKEIYGGDIKAIYLKSTSYNKFEGEDRYIYNTFDTNSLEDTISNSYSVVENGIKFYVDWEKGQKTGFFLDQRENRLLVGKYANNRNVLNLFCYTGGFSLYAIRGGATHVDSVDSSKYAIEATNKNFILNNIDESKYTSYCLDAIKYLDGVQNGIYNLMIVDPPAFAKHLSAKSNAIRAYRRLNALAIEKISHGGIIFTFSCSQVVDKNDFALAIFSAAAQAKRRVRILHRLTQPLDHPVSIYHPEGEYLKGLVLFVE